MTNETVYVDYLNMSLKNVVLFDLDLRALNEKAEILKAQT